MELIRKGGREEGLISELSQSDFFFFFAIASFIWLSQRITILKQQRQKWLRRHQIHCRKFREDAGLARRPTIPALHFHSLRIAHWWFMEMTGWFSLSFCCSKRSAVYFLFLGQSGRSFSRLEAAGRGLVVVVEHLVLLPHNKMRQQYQEKMNYYHYKFHEAPWGIAKGRKDTSDLTVYVERIFNLPRRFPKENLFSTLTSRLILIVWCVRMHYASCGHVMGSGRTGHAIQRWPDSPVTCTFGWKKNGWMDLSCWRHLNKQDSYCVQMFVFAVSTHFLITCGLGKLSSAFQPTNKVNAANY